MFDLFEADLMDMKKHKGDNKNYQYILLVMDAFSKFAYAEPLKNKTGVEVTKAMKKILQRSKHPPKLLQTDNGSEFYNPHFKKLMKENGIHLYSSYSTIKASHVERLVRTIKGMLYKKFSENGSYNYLKILQDVINEYNCKQHRTIRMAPKDVGRHNEQYLLKTIYKNLPPLDSVKKHGRSVLKENDYVRISKYRKQFDKGYLPNFTTEVFQISRVRNTKPKTYMLRDLNGEQIQGAFYNEELKPTKYKDEYLVEKILKKRGDKVLIKWLGFDKPTWELKKNILTA